MKVVLLSGGKGKRLWPASTDEVPKQFIKIFNESSSMLSKTYNHISKIINKKEIFIATGQEYQDEIINEIPKFSNFIIEPDYIGTFGAILNIAVYMKEIEKASLNEIISIVPIDHDVEDGFYNSLFEAQDQMEKNHSDICLIGINPSFPSTQYGYIIHNEKNIIESFVEKPNEDKAIHLLNQKALWNSGIVVLRLEKLIRIANKYLKYNSYSDFATNYSKLPHISFDIEVLEKTKNISIIKSNSNWSDIGTWEILAPKISEADKYNTNIINFEKKEIVNDGIEDAIIINSPNGLKLIKKKTNKRVYRKWGYYIVLQDFKKTDMYLKIKQLVIFPNNNISYQYHNYKNEVWYILEGEGKTIVDGKIRNIKKGDVISINKKVNHTIRATKKITIIEIQYGKQEIEEDDIVRIELDWDKILKII